MNRFLAKIYEINVDLNVKLPAKLFDKTDLEYRLKIMRLS